MRRQYDNKLTIGASTEAVFKSLTTPSDIRSWYGSVAQLALRPHGHFTHADIEGDVYESGEFLEVKNNELLKYTVEHHGFYKGSEVTISLKGSGQTTVLQITHTGLSESDLSHASASWDWALQNLKSYLESGTTQTFKGWFSTRKDKYNV